MEMINTTVTPRKEWSRGCPAQMPNNIVKHNTQISNDTNNAFSEALATNCPPYHALHCLLVVAFQKFPEENKRQ